MDEIVGAVLTGTAVTVLVIGALFLRTHDKLDDVHDEVKDVRGEVKSAHQRHDRNDEEVRYLHFKVDKLKRMLAAVFHADAKAFMDEWRK